MERERGREGEHGERERERGREAEREIQRGIGREREWREGLGEDEMNGDLQRIQVHENKCKSSVPPGILM
eukprot:1350652-Amorphochlora_amoeboformis.AAC.2